MGKRDSITYRSPREWAVLTVIGIAFGLTVYACTPPTAPDIDIYNNNQATNNGGGGSPTASPSPGSGGDLPPNSTVRVGIFGMSCPAGVVVPNNGARQIPGGCTAYLTATPKGADGIDLSPAVHGPNCAWRADGVIDLSQATEAFNQDARCPSPGDSTVTATVKNLSGSVGIACLAGTGSRTFGPPTFVWFEGDDLPAAPRLSALRRDAIVRALDAYEAGQ
jgi:hypothetical protein